MSHRLREHWFRGCCHAGMSYICMFGVVLTTQGCFKAGTWAGCSVQDGRRISSFLRNAEWSGFPASPETKVIALHFCRWQYGSIVIQICAVGSKRRIFSALECVLTVQDHPRSMILVPIESAYATSYLSPIVTVVLPCTISEIRRLIS